MIESESERTCPKCGHEMRMVPESSWTLFDVRAVDYICPNCLHVDTVTAIVLKKERWK